MTAEEFVERVLAGICHAKKVCCGFNFHFGRGGRADSAALAELCEARGIRAEIVPAVMADGAPVSSTRIRGLIAKGFVEEAARLLGHPYGYESEVRHGRQLGRELGTPTVNQKIPKDFVLPRFGVYASKVYFDGHEYYGVTNVGIKPTVGSSEALAETWIPEYHGRDFYGEQVKVDLHWFIRPERKFESLRALRDEIMRNAEQARDYFIKNNQ